MINQTILEKIKPGATVRVIEKVAVAGGAATGGKEGAKERMSRFEGLVISRKHGNEAGAGFTIRATIAGVGVEKVFPINLPSIEKVEIISSPRKVKRAKLYYVRDISRRAVRQKTMITPTVGEKKGKAAAPAPTAEKK